MQISSLIPTHGRRKLLDTTLRSFAELQLPQSYRATIVIENGPNPAGEGYFESFKQSHPFEYRYCPRPNKSAALNTVLGDLRQGLVIFFDDDIRVNREALEAYARAAEQYGPGHYFGGTVIPDYERTPPSWVREFLPLSARGLDQEFVQSKGVSRAGLNFLGMNWAAFAEDIHAVGLFETEFGPGSRTGATGQERTTIKKLDRAGIRPVYVPDAVVWHYVPASTFSRRWILNRSFRRGTEKALSMGRDWDHRRWGFGALAVEISRDLKRMGRTVVSLPSKSDAHSFHVLTRLWALGGFLQGIYTRLRDSGRQRNTR